MVPSPSAKKNRRWIVCGTFAGNRKLLKLRSEFVQLAMYAVALNGGNGGIGSVLMEELVVVISSPSYSRTPIEVVVSKVVVGNAEYGLVAIKNTALEDRFFVLRRTLVVCPDAMYIVSVSNGFT